MKRYSLLELLKEEMCKTIEDKIGQLKYDALENRVDEVRINLTLKIDRKNAIIMLQELKDREKECFCSHNRCERCGRYE